MKSFKIDCFAYQVEADWYQGQTDKEILLVLIGWNSTRQRYEDLVSAIIKNTGISALVFEYSGHGTSQLDINKTTPAQHFMEVIHVFDWLTNKYPKANITVMGASYGGYLAMQLTKYRQFARLILRAPAMYQPEDFYTANNVVNSEADWQSRRSFREDKTALAKHPLFARAINFKGKKLLVIHENDEVIPVATTDAYATALKPDIYVAKDMPHSLHSASRDAVIAYQRHISDWISHN